jgi:hypothetical protein
VKYINQIKLEIYNLFLLNDDSIKFNSITVNYDYNTKNLIKNKDRIDNMIKIFPNWKKHIDLIQKPIDIIAQNLLNDLDNVSKFDLENYILNSPKTAYNCLMKQDIINFKDKLEDAISIDPYYSYRYALKNKERFLKGEKSIIESKDIEDEFNSFSDDSFEHYGTSYSKYVIDGRWSEYEEYLIKNFNEQETASKLLEYLRVFNIKDLYFEKTFKKLKPYDLYLYYKKVLQKPKEFFLTTDPIITYYYLIDSNFEITDEKGYLLDEKTLLNKYKDFLKVIMKSPKLCYQFCEIQQIRLIYFEKEVFPKSPYWAFYYIKDLFNLGIIDNYKVIHRNTLKKLEKYPKIMGILNLLNILKSNYSFGEDELDPKDYGENIT